MTSRIRLAAAVVALGVAALAPALGITIEPGVYKMEWRVPEPDHASFGGHRGTGVAQIGDRQISLFKGIRSAEALMGRAGPYTIVIDESDGTGTGYDIAYVFERPSDDSAYDLGSAAKIKLNRNGQVLVPQDADGLLIDQTMGRPGSQITKKAALSLSAAMTVREDGKEEPDHAVLTLRGGWYGKLRTDEGELDVQVIDMDLDGAFDDPLSVDLARSSVVVGDMILLGGTPTRFEDYQKLVYIAETSCYDDKLYRFDVSATGDTVTIEPYAGDVGTISVKAIDGYGKPAQCTGSAFYGEAGVFYRSGPRMAVPPGNYGYLTATIMPEQSGPNDDVFGVRVRPDGIVKVAANKETVVKVGGPMNVEIEPESRTITAKAGEQKTVRLVLTVGGEELAGVEGNRRAWVNIRDSKGKLLSSEQTGFGRRGTCPYSVRIPSDWKPGAYRIGVSFDPSPYQKTIFAKKTLTVVK